MSSTASAFCSGSPPAPPNPPTHPTPLTHLIHTSPACRLPRGPSPLTPSPSLSWRSPDAVGAARLASRGLSPLSLSAALGLWHTQPAAALPVAALLPALRAALVEVHTPAHRHAAVPGGAAAVPAVPAASARGGGATGMGRPPPPLAVLTSGEGSPGSSGAMLHDAAPGAPSSVRLVGARRRTIVLREAQLRGGSLQIVDCHACYIYVLAPVPNPPSHHPPPPRPAPRPPAPHPAPRLLGAPSLWLHLLSPHLLWLYSPCQLRCVELLGCCGCTVLLGAVEAVVSLLHCERLRLHCATRALRLHNCLDTSLALCIATPPLLWGDNHRLTLAPLHSAYAGLAAHLATAGLSPHLEHNYWSRPLHLSHELSAASPADATSGDAPPPHALAPPPHAPLPGAADERVVLLPPHKLTPFHVPVDVPAGAAQARLRPAPAPAPAPALPRSPAPAPALTRSPCTGLATPKPPPRPHPSTLRVAGPRYGAGV